MQTDNTEHEADTSSEKGLQACNGVLCFSSVNYKHIPSMTKTRSKELFLGFIKALHDYFKCVPVVCCQMASPEGFAIILHLSHHVQWLLLTRMSWL